MLIFNPVADIMALLKLLKENRYSAISYKEVEQAITIYNKTKNTDKYAIYKLACVVYDYAKAVKEQLYQNSTNSFTNLKNKPLIFLLDKIIQQLEPFYLGREARIQFVKDAIVPNYGTFTK